MLTCDLLFLLRKSNQKCLFFQASSHSCVNISLEVKFDIRSIAVMWSFVVSGWWSCVTSVNTLWWFVFVYFWQEKWPFFAHFDCFCLYVQEVLPEIWLRVTQKQTTTVVWILALKWNLTLGHYQLKPIRLCSANLIVFKIVTYITLLHSAYVTLIYLAEVAITGKNTFMG